MQPTTDMDNESTAGSSDGMADPPALGPTTRALLLNVLWHNQGGNSVLGQAMRRLLGIDRFAHMSDSEVRAAKRVEEAINADAAPAPYVPMSEQNARAAIDGAIALGRIGIQEPPKGHWLTEYWHIGQQLAELGKTSAWDNMTPVDAAQSADASNATNPYLEATRIVNEEAGRTLQLAEFDLCVRIAERCLLAADASYVAAGHQFADARNMLHAALMELYTQVKDANEETDLNPVFGHEVSVITRLLHGDLFTPAAPAPDTVIERLDRAANTAAIAADGAGNGQRAQAIARAVAAHNRAWPEQLTSGVMFYEGERITKAEFLAEVRG